MTFAGLTPLSPTVRRELIATGPIRDVAVGIPLEHPRVLVVRVDTEATAVMVHVATDDAKGRIHDTDLACGLAVPVGTRGAIRPDAVLVANHPVSDQVVRHANQEDARHLREGRKQSGRIQ